MKFMKKNFSIQYFIDVINMVIRRLLIVCCRMFGEKKEVEMMTNEINNNFNLV